MPSAAPTAPHPKLVPTTVAAAHTGLPDETIRRLVRKGLPCVRIGPKFYFDLDKVNDWFDRAAESAAAEDGWPLRRLPSPLPRLPQARGRSRTRTGQ